MKHKRNIIGLVGKIACGKGTCANYLREKYGAVTLRYSDILRDILDRLHIETSRVHLQNISTFLREHFGEDILARVIANDVEKVQANLVIVEGIRRMADIKYLRELDEFHLVSIEADEMKRYQRIVTRMENPGDNSKTYDEFLRDEQRETELQIPIVMSKASINIKNNGTIEDLHTSTEKYIIQSL